MLQYFLFVSAFISISMSSGLLSAHEIFEIDFEDEAIPNITFVYKNEKSVVRQTYSDTLTGTYDSSQCQGNRLYLPDEGRINFQFTGDSSGFGSCSNIGFSLKNPKGSFKFTILDRMKILEPGESIPVLGYSYIFHVTDFFPAKLIRKE